MSSNLQCAEMLFKKIEEKGFCFSTSQKEIVSRILLIFKQAIEKNQTSRIILSLPQGSGKTFISLFITKFLCDKKFLSKVLVLCP